MGNRRLPIPQRHLNYTNPALIYAVYFVGRM